MRFFTVALFLPILLASSLTAEISENEALALRRIADFWEEGEYQIAKNQMESFLEEFSDSPYRSKLSSALGDLFLREKSYQTALNYYAQIDDPELNDKIFLHRMQCLYHLEWHATLADECEAYLKREETDPAHRLEATYLLAIALYTQALAPQKDPQTLIALAERAKPYFERLSHSELSEEVAGAFAHLQCILKDYPAASKIYVDLAEKSEAPEQYLFQAALIQSKYDQDLALKTFDRLAGQKEGDLAKEASYNRLVLFFEQGRHEEIIAEKEKFFLSAPPGKKGLVSLFVGQSYLHLKKYGEAAAEISAFLDSDVPENRLRPALLFLADAAYHSDNLDLLEVAIARLEKNDVELPKTRFCRALLLKKQMRLEEAKEELVSILASFPQFAERSQAAIELIHLYSEQKEWALAKEAAASFLKEEAQSEVGWNLLLNASNELGDKRQFIQDIEAMLEICSFHRNEWLFRLAKAYFELGESEKTIEVLGPIVDSDANAQILFAFALRDGRGDEENFCIWAEKALSSQASLLSIAQQHVGLFNSYLKQGKLEKAADHLFLALVENGEIQPANLFWLADHFYARFEKDSGYANAAFGILTRLPQDSKEAIEPFLLKLAKLHRHFKRVQIAKEVLEELNGYYRASPESNWNCSKEAKVYLAELYLSLGELEKAKNLFEEVAASGTYRDRFTASAALQSVRLKHSFQDEAAFEKAVCRLKDLVLQKKLEHEPIYLEAALDCVNLLCRNDPSKKIFLLKKMKASFEAQDDLLSKDYHAAFERFPEQAHLYRAYMSYLDAEILEEKSLHTKAKEILLQINSGIKDPLLSRIEAR